MGFVLVTRRNRSARRFASCLLGAGVALAVSQTWAATDAAADAGVAVNAAITDAPSGSGASPVSTAVPAATAAAAPSSTDAGALAPAIRTNLPDVAPAGAASSSAAVPPAAVSASSAVPGTTDMPEAQPASDSATVPPALDGAPMAAGSDATDNADLWERIRRGFKMPDLANKRADASTRWYAGKPDYIARMASRANLYLYHIVDEIEKRGMPMEIALLPFVESAMQPEAVSVAKAAGLWQFIPSTGKKYSLEQNIWKDERFNVVESTRAALDYLQALYAEFGDWQLALAAYNYGEGGVERALAKARAAHKSSAYADLKLPTETQFYVPKLQAIKNIIADPQRYGVTLPNIANQPYFTTVYPTEDMDVATAAHLADMPLDDFRALNPEFNRPLIVGAASPSVLLPADKAELFSANLVAWKSTGQPLASWTAYVLESGDTLAKVAQRVGIPEAQLRSANHIPSRYRPAVGSTILVPRDDDNAYDVPAGLVDASFSLIPDFAGQRPIYSKVRRGETLASVAKRWHVSADDIVSWNQLRSPALLQGQRLVLTVAAANVSPRPAVHHASATVHTGAATSHKPAAKGKTGSAAAVKSSSAHADAKPAAHGSNRNRT